MTSETTYSSGVRAVVGGSGIHAAQSDGCKSAAPPRPTSASKLSCDHAGADAGFFSSGSASTDSDGATRRTDAGGT
eukprot:1228795-Prymnesium_polylepis.1